MLGLGLPLTAPLVWSIVLADLVEPRRDASGKLLITVHEPPVFRRRDPAEALHVSVSE